MTNTETPAAGYYFWCNLSKCYIAVNANGDRASCRNVSTAARFAEGI